MRAKTLAITVTVLLGTLVPSAARASKCNVVADDNYKLLVLGAVEAKRKFVREQICPVEWDMKNEVWHAPGSVVKRCLKGQWQLADHGKMRTALADLDANPRSAHFVFSIAKSSDAKIWGDFGRLVHVNMPSPPSGTAAVGTLAAATGVATANSLFFTFLETGAAKSAAVAAAARATAAEAAAIDAAQLAARAAATARELETAAAAVAGRYSFLRMGPTYANVYRQLYGVVRANMFGSRQMGLAMEGAVNRVTMEAAQKISLRQADATLEEALRIARVTEEGATAANASATAARITAGELSAGAAAEVGVSSMFWPVAVAEILVFSLSYALDQTCEAKWYDARKRLLDSYYVNGGAISYSFRVNTGPKAEDNYVEQTVLAHLKGKGAPAMFPLLQDRRPLEYR